MENKTIEKINKISSMDSELLPRMLLEYYDASFRFFCSVPDGMQRDWEELMGELDLKNIALFSKHLLEYLGFSKEDEIASGFLTEYCTEVVTDKDIFKLKKNFIEWAIELEEIKKGKLDT